MLAFEMNCKAINDFNDISKNSSLREFNHKFFRTSRDVIYEWTFLNYFLIALDFFTKVIKHDDIVHEIILLLKTYFAIMD
jgi:hypothetical protein